MRAILRKLWRWISGEEQREREEREWKEKQRALAVKMLMAYFDELDELEDFRSPGTR